MRNLFILFAACTLVLVSMSCAKKSESKIATMTIEGQLMHTRSYCGGAAPSETLLQKYRTPTPLKEFTLYLKKGSKNQESVPVFKELVTDDQGKFSISIPEGDYVVLIESQLDRSIFNKRPDFIITNREKLESWWTDGVASVNKENTMVEISVHELCDVPFGLPFVRNTMPPRP